MDDLRRNQNSVGVSDDAMSVNGGWMDDLRFYVLFNSISVISGQCLDDNILRTNGHCR